MPAPYHFDVFVSYRQRSPDKEWVRGLLCKALREAGLSVFIDVEQFRLGEPVINEMARGVEESTYTVAVATPAYLQSSYTEFENSDQSTPRARRRKSPPRCRDARSLRVAAAATL